MCRRSKSSQLVGILALLIAVAVVACSIETSNPVPDVSQVDRPWVLESEFTVDPSLYASQSQIIVLELEEAQLEGDPIHDNAVRLLLENSSRFSLCIPADEPFVVRAQLKRVGAVPEAANSADSAEGVPVLTSYPGGRCDRVQLSAGYYTLDIFHDARQVPTAGVKAFFYNPQKLDILGSDASSSGTDLAFMVFKGPDGNYVTNDSFVFEAANLATVGTTVDSYSVWQVVGGPSPFGLENGAGKGVNIQVNTPSQQCFPELYIGSQGGGPICGDTPVQLTMQGAPDAFGLQAVGANTTYGIDIPVIVEGGILQYTFEPYTDQPAVMSADYRGFRCVNDDCSGSALVLQPGEVALFSACKFEGPAVVFHSDVPDLSVYDTVAQLGLGLGDDMAASLRVGPDTLVTLYPDAEYGGATLSSAADIPCLDDTALGSGTASSLQLVADAADFIISSNGCVNCNLTGIDLSGNDLTAAHFAGANFTNANLAMTLFPLADLSGATLTSATIAGADLSAADLRCSDLSNTDLTSATLGRSEWFPLISDSGAATIFAVDPATGQRAILSGPGAGSGPELSDLVGVSDGGSGSLLVTNIDTNPAVLKVDTESGDRTIVSGSGVGGGPTFNYPVGAEMTDDGSLLVLDGVRGQLFRVEAVSGDRTIIANDRTGSGPGLAASLGFVQDTTGTVLVASGQPAVVRVALATGDRTLVSGSGVGTGPGFVELTGIALAGDGSILVLDSQLSSILRVDPVSGERTVVSGPAVGSGPAFVSPFSIAVAFDGSLLVADTGATALFQVDPASGDRTILSGPSNGDGPQLVAPVGLAIYDPAPTITAANGCRLLVRAATLNLATFPLSYWRYMDLSGATIEGVAGATLSTKAAPLDLSGALLSGVDFSTAIMDGANLGCFPSKPGQTAACPSSGTTPVCAVLQGTKLNYTSLKGACLRSANLQGADLSYANLDGADLGSADLQALTYGAPATLTGAFLRDVTLTSANLTGVIANYANFYSSESGTASASGATMTGSKWNNAYLANVDLANAVLQSTEWNQAVLLGATFDSADLSKNTTAGEITDFSGAYLQGTDFDNAQVTDANFTSSYWDVAGNVTLNIELQRGNLEFTGYWNDPGAAECVQAIYPTTTFPITSGSNTCPDGSLGPCDAVWEKPQTPIDQATPAVAVDPALPGNCSVTDILWTFPLD